MRMRCKALVCSDLRPASDYTTSIFTQKNFLWQVELELYPDISGCPRPTATCDCRAHRLYRLVQQHHIHGHKSRCYDMDGDLASGYPFAVMPVTRTDERDHVFHPRRTEADRWVVPHNSSLTVYDCLYASSSAATLFFQRRADGALHLRVWRDHPIPSRAWKHWAYTSRGRVSWTTQSRAAPPHPRRQWKD